MQSCEWLHFLFCDKVFPYSIQKFEKIANYYVQIM